MRIFIKGNKKRGSIIFYNSIPLKKFWQLAVISIDLDPLVLRHKISPVLPFSEFNFLTIINMNLKIHPLKQENINLFQKTTKKKNPFGFFLNFIKIKLVFL